MAQAHAGMVMGGVMLARSPCIPPSISFRMLGTPSARSRNRSWGVPQSSPMTATLGACVIRRLPDRPVVEERSPAPFAAAPRRILPTSRTARPSCENGVRHDAAQAGPVLAGSVVGVLRRRLVHGAGVAGRAGPGPAV